eukprot:m.288513 g.288513  ORF g.288513 m.288513 type:complete len:535 (+) comp19962_c0_seq1:277-1881(+)
MAGVAQDGEASMLETIDIVEAEDVPGSRLAHTDSAMFSGECDDEIAYDPEKAGSGFQLTSPAPLKIAEGDDDVDDASTVGVETASAAAGRKTSGGLPAVSETALSGGEGATDTTGSPDLDASLADPTSAAWRRHEKHVFIFSIAGKPIYSRHGDEDKLASMFGVMQALVSFVQEDGNALHSIKAGDFRIVFQQKGPIVLVMASRSGEVEKQMELQLNYVYSQIIFVLTYSQLKRIFEQQINYDLRRMLTGTEKFIDSLLELMDVNPSFFLGAVRCLPLHVSVRDRIGQVLQNCRISDLVFAVLIADNQLISLLRPRKYSLQPADLHLIFNLVASSEFSAGECYIPMCLPRFNNTGFLHAHVSYVDEASTACLLLITDNREAFYELNTCRAKIVQALSSNGCLQEISKAVTNNSYQIDNMEVPDLRHFLYKSKSIAQYTSPTLEAPYNLPGERLRLFRRYQSVHNRIHSAARPLKIYFHNGQKESLLGWVTQTFELYACFGPLVTKPAAINAVLRLIRWMKREEDGLFIPSSLVF